jgi:hypothetical protein
MVGLGVVILLLLVVLKCSSCSRHIFMAEAAKIEISSNETTSLTLEKVREALIRQEDTIVFRLIERASFPLNSPTYDHKFSSSLSLFHFIVKGTESLQSQVINQSGVSRFHHILLSRVMYVMFCLFLLLFA